MPGIGSGLISSFQPTVRQAANNNGRQGAGGSPSVERSQGQANRQGANDKENRQKPPGDPMAEAVARAKQAFNAVRAWAEGEGHKTVAHESSHLCSQSGGMHLDYKTLSQTLPNGQQESVTYAAAGHVPINIPGMPAIAANDNNAQAKLQSTVATANEVAAAAAGPGGDMSGADKGVEAAAKGVAAMATALMSKLSGKPATDNKTPGQAPKAANDDRPRLNVVA